MAENLLLTHAVRAAIVLASSLFVPCGLPGQAPPRATATPPAQAPTRSVAEVARSRIGAAAVKIDRLLEKGLQQRQLAPSALLDDAAFARRAYLDIAGRNPSLPEIEAVLLDARADKRARLVDHLLDSPGYVSNESNFWFDLLRVKSRQRQLSGEPFAHWIRDSIRTGVPYDQFVAAMVTATGAAHEDGNGATGFLLRDMNMPHDAMANTLRLFTGTRLECAQCHNHPFESWKQRDFFAMAAFYGGLQYRMEVDRDTQLALRKELQNGDDRQKQQARRALQTMTAGLRGSGSGQERLPQDYAYDDAAPRTPIAATTIFGPKVEVRQPKTAASAGRTKQARAGTKQADAGSRRVFADWLTSPNNERFSRVLVNRTWQRLFGRGLTDPVDDYKEDSKAVHPELERYLEQLLVELDFDVRQFQRVLLSTRLYQQQCLAEDPPVDAAYAFQAPLPQRLRAEQVWDSLVTLVNFEIDATLRDPSERARAVYERQAKMTSGDPEAILAAIQRRPDPEATIRERLTQLAAARGGNRANGSLLRASDLEQPAPQSHLLRQFGQSDRETIDGATRAVTVPQAMTLMNGLLVADGADAAKAIAAPEEAPAKIRRAYYAVLARDPSPREAARWTAELAARPREALADLLWVLCNSNEFRSRP